MFRRALAFFGVCLIWWQPGDPSAHLLFAHDRETYSRYKLWTLNAKKTWCENQQIQSAGKPMCISPTALGVPKCWIFLSTSLPEVSTALLNIRYTDIAQTFFIHRYCIRCTVHICTAKQHPSPPKKKNGQHHERNKTANIYIYPPKNLSVMAIPRGTGKTRSGSQQPKDIIIWHQTGNVHNEIHHFAGWQKHLKAMDVMQPSKDIKIY